jgi:hypothetical protein
LAPVRMSSAIAGPDKVKFPHYQTHVLYDVLDQPENKEVRELYVNAEALKDLRAGQPLASGTVLSAPTFKALLDDRLGLEVPPSLLARADEVIE